MSGRRGDSDFTLQEEGNGTLPPHAQWALPTYDYMQDPPGLAEKGGSTDATGTQVRK